MPFEYKSVTFREETGSEKTTWRVHANNTTSLGIGFDFPDTLKAVYPALTLNGLNYTSGYFYRSSGTYTYEDMLAYRFKNVLKDEFELFTLSSK